MQRSYTIRFSIREPDELVQIEDYLCFGCDQSKLSSWTKLHPESEMIGKPACTFTHLPIGSNDTI